MNFTLFLLNIFGAFSLMLLLMPRLIPELRKLKFGQEVRDDGPQSHLKKQGTPTMGGIGFVSVILLYGIVMLLLLRRNPRESKLLPVLLLTVGFAAVGFLDDYLKVVKHQSEGFKPKQKFACQLLLTLLFIGSLSFSKDFSTRMPIPFLSMELELGWFYVPAVLFIVTATDNGANFTDGVDGLCASVTAVLALFLAAVSFAFSDGELALPAGAVFGALLGFLWFNANPAKVFMGDTGSLALGGFVAATALELNIALFIPIFAFIYLIEVVSVILQVGYFKATHGKRIFRMAPIHHHFELGGWSETRVVTNFTIVTILLCLLSFGVLWASKMA